MFCPKCGNNLADSAKFCDKCGETMEDPLNQASFSKTGADAKMLVTQATTAVFTYLSAGVALLCAILLFQNMIAVSFMGQSESASIYKILTGLRSASEYADFFSSSSGSIGPYVALFWGFMIFAVIIALLYAAYIYGVFTNNKKISYPKSGLACTVVYIVLLQILVIAANSYISSQAGPYAESLGSIFSLTFTAYLTGVIALLSRIMLVKKVMEEA